MRQDSPLSLSLSLALPSFRHDYGIIRERSYSYDARGPRASFRLCASVRASSPMTNHNNNKPCPSDN